MRKRRAGKRRSSAIVGVITSATELRLARRMRMPPDFFELRLDYLRQLRESDIAGLERPLIITARSASEGGATKLRNTQRRDLLLKFLPFASFVDVELRSVRWLQAVWDDAEKQKIGRICSHHDANGTPALTVLVKYLSRATTVNADVFKLVTRADSISAFSTLINFLRYKRGSSVRRCVMATGKFGPISRVLFPEYGSGLIYAPLGHVFHEGQLTFNELQTLRDFYAKR